MDSEARLVRKAQAGRRTTTWLAATSEGKKAFTRHLAVLNQIASEPASGTPGSGAD